MLFNQPNPQPQIGQIFFQQKNLFPNPLRM